MCKHEPEAGETRATISRASFTLLTAIVLMATSAFGAPPPDVTRGMVLRYSFESLAGDGVVPDESPGAVRHDGILVGFPTFPRTVRGPGGVGRALVFNRRHQQRIDVPTTGAMTLRRFTLAAWAKITEDNTPEQNWEVAERGGSFWLNVRNAGQGHRLRLGLFAGTWDRDGIRRLDSTERIPRGQWVHLAGSFDGSTMRVYVDGRLQGVVLTGISQPLYDPVEVDEPLRIGAKWSPTQNPSPMNWWQGALDEVRLYRRALANWEIKRLAQLPRP